MMNHLERIQARLLIGTQLELIGWWLDHEELNDCCYYAQTSSLRLPEMQSKSLLHYL